MRRGWGGRTLRGGGSSGGAPRGVFPAPATAGGSGGGVGSP